MKYESAKTDQGNVGVSYESQERADEQALAMDEAGNKNCTNCWGCRDCTRCTDCMNCWDCANCTDCARCTDCTNCKDCMDCKGCTGCVGCTRCKDCTGCVGCTGCKDCTGCRYCTDCMDCPSQPMQLLGLYWTVTIRKEPSIQIGCQDHPTQFWRNASDSEIAAMDPQALEFWREHKERILALAREYQT